MKTLPVGEIKSHFSEIITEVQHGAKIGILFGKAKKPVAMVVPYEAEKLKVRKLGPLDGKTKIVFKDDFEMSDSELIDL